MKLAVKLTSALVLGIGAVMAICAAVQISNEDVLSEADAHRAWRNGLVWLGAVESVWAREGEARARELIELSRRRAGAEGVLRVCSLAPDAPDRAPLSAEDVRALEAGDVLRRVLPDAEGQEWQHAWVAVRTAAQPTAIEHLEPLAQERTFIRMSHLAILGATVAIVVVCALLVSFLHVRLVGRPLEHLRDKARRAGAGDFSKPLLLRRHDEMGDVAAEINAMCDRIAEANRRAADEAAARFAALEQLRHSERLATVGQPAPGVPHQLGPPLNGVRARAQPLPADGVPPPPPGRSVRPLPEQPHRRMTR